MKFRVWNIEKQSYDYFEKEIHRFTGYKDVNGKDIYEGDLLDTSEKYLSMAKTGQVYWYNPVGAFGIDIDYDCLFIPLYDLNKEYLRLV